MLISQWSLVVEVYRSGLGSRSRSVFVVDVEKDRWWLCSLCGGIFLVMSKRVCHLFGEGGVLLGDVGVKVLLWVEVVVFQLLFGFSFQQLRGIHDCIVMLFWWTGGEKKQVLGCVYGGGFVVCGGGDAVGRQSIIIVFTVVFGDV